MSEQVLNVLRETKQILAKPESWVKNALAVKVNGEKTFAQDPEAIGFCVVGAMNKVTGRSNILWDCINTVEKYVPSDYRNVVAFNNDPGTTYEMILELLDTAINREAEHAN
jgi:hypothetical protein